MFFSPSEEGQLLWVDIHHFLPYPYLLLSRPLQFFLRHWLADVPVFISSIDFELSY